MPQSGQPNCLQLKMQHLKPLRAQKALSVTIGIIRWLKPIFVSSHLWPLEPLCPFIRSLRLGLRPLKTPPSTLSPPVIPCITGPPSSQYEVRRSGGSFLIIIPLQLECLSEYTEIYTYIYTIYNYEVLGVVVSVLSHIHIYI